MPTHQLETATFVRLSAFRDRTANFEKNFRKSLANPALERSSRILTPLSTTLGPYCWYSIIKCPRPVIMLGLAMQLHQTESVREALRIRSAEERAREDIRVIMEMTLALVRQGFGRLRCFPELRMADGEEQLSCCIAIAPAACPMAESWMPIWSYNDQLRWRLPEPGNPRRVAALLAADRGPTGFLRVVIGNAHAAATVGGSDGYEEWLANALALGDQTIVVLGWQGMEARPSSPRVVPSLAGNVNVSFPPGFFVS